MISIQIADEQLILLPQRAAYWPRTRTLFVADLHLGKSAAFRAGAVPLPEGNMQADLERLSHAIERTEAKQMIILGDLLHARSGREPVVMRIFDEWRAMHESLKIMLVRGNHDRGAGDPPESWRIICTDGPTPGPYFVLSHEPHTPENGYALCGHLHPAAQLFGAGKQRMKLPCFWFREKSAVLPAFGSFTGGATITPGADDRVFAVTERAVIEIEQ